ncbi:GNVR domain-containing protein, partial [Shewanella algae]|uniref:GNVR domain-containing protein n=1 Tax=Shewanella algae TaxID=38313 RepID=UPI003AAE850E
LVFGESNYTSPSCCLIIHHERSTSPNIADIRTILYKLIEDQAKTIMFAEVRDEYVFKTIDPAFIPEEKAKPNRALICILGTMLGGMLSVMVVLIRHFVGKKI